METIRVARLQELPPVQGRIIEATARKNWMGWDRTFLRLRLDDGRIAMGELDAGTAKNLPQRVQFYWSGNDHDGIYLSQQLHPAVLLAISWGGPITAMIFLGCFRPQTTHERPNQPRLRLNT